MTEEASAQPQEDVFDPKIIQEPLERLLASTANNLERVWSAYYRPIQDARVVFYVRVRIAINTYSAIMYLCADTPKDPLRNPKFVLAIPPLVRTLFEELVTIIFLLHDIPTYIPYLLKTGYTEHWRELDYSLKYHGSDPAWADYIDNLKKQMQQEETTLGLTAAEKAHPDSTIGRWPQPNKIVGKLKRQHSSSPAIPFIEFVNAWMYRRLSGQTHLDLMGIRKRGIHFSEDEAKRAFGDNWEAKLADLLGLYGREQIYTMFTLLLAIASEIEAHFKYDLKERAKFVWQVLSEYSDISKDFYERRYQQLLS
ncbi:MAG TPA: hypothetical protein VGC87_09735 [Pyrinomonadaceae bacterium]|jgi:hypothetical protein